MDDDPDDLAAAFFAQEAAKEKAKAALPTDDWISVIEGNKSIGGGGATGDCGGARKDAKGKLLEPPAKSIEEIDPRSWLVTTMPTAPKYHTATEEDDDGIVGIILDSSANHCSLLGKKDNAVGDTTNYDSMESKEMTPKEEEIRRQMKDYMVQKLEEKIKNI